MLLPSINLGFALIKMLTSSRQDAALVETVYSSWPLSSGCHNPFTKWCLLALYLKRSSRIWQKAGYFQLENVASICSQLPPCIGAVMWVIHKSAPTEKSFSFLEHFLFYILNLTKSAIPTAVWEAQPSLTRQRGSLLINKSSLNSLEVPQCDPEDHTPPGPLNSRMDKTKSGLAPIHPNTAFHHQPSEFKHFQQTFLFTPFANNTDPVPQCEKHFCSSYFTSFKEEKMQMWLFYRALYRSQKRPWAECTEQCKHFSLMHTWLLFSSVDVI